MSVAPSGCDGSSGTASTTHSGLRCSFMLAFPLCATGTKNGGSNVAHPGPAEGYLHRGLLRARREPPPPCAEKGDDLAPPQVEHETSSPAGGPRHTHPAMGRRAGPWADLKCSESLWALPGRTPQRIASGSRSLHCGISALPMSALGQSLTDRHDRDARPMSASPPILSVFIRRIP